jgi:hypothetical protein
MLVCAVQPSRGLVTQTKVFHHSKEVAVVQNSIRYTEVMNTAAVVMSEPTGDGVSIFNDFVVEVFLLSSLHGVLSGS